MPAVLNLTALIEGFYDNSSGKMAVDTAIVYLRNESAPYSITDSSKSVIDTNGNGTFTFQNAAGGNPYYIILKHRNSIETWSSSVQTFTSNSLSYNFTTAANKAYGDNLIQKGGKYCIYSGDVNNDGYIDLTDVISINNDVVNFVSGYKQSDLNGDSVVDLTDIVTDYNNTVKFVKVIRP
ncbi:MAG: hypothetical protein IPL53_04035 [Ignavibacteria bacterium]|nr:hypothetical protein [Ignavibacteria bacterium]